MDGGANFSRTAACFLTLSLLILAHPELARALIVPPDPGGGPLFVEYVGGQFGNWSDASNWRNENGNPQTPSGGDDIYLGLTSAGSNTTDNISSLNTSLLEFVSGGNSLTIIGGSLNVNVSGVRVGSGASAVINVDGAGAQLSLFSLTDPTVGPEDIYLVFGGKLNLLSGNVTIGSLACNSSGTVSLGGQELSVGTTNRSTTYSGTIEGSGGSIRLIGGTLALNNANTYTGGTTVNAGVLTVNNTSGSGTGTGAVSITTNGQVVNNGTIGGNVSVSGLLSGCGTINGTLTVNLSGVVNFAGCAVTINGAITNDGLFILRNGATLTGSSSSFTNHGTLDISTAGTFARPGFTNSGTIITASVIKAKSIQKSGNTATVKIASYTGHSYQLQRSTTSPSPASFSDIGSPQQGSTGTDLSFPDGTATGPRAFYRIVVN